MHLVICTRQIVLAVVLPASVAIADALGSSHASASQSLVVFLNYQPLLILVSHC